MHMAMLINLNEDQPMLIERYAIYLKLDVSLAPGYMDVANLIFCFVDFKKSCATVFESFHT